MRAVVVVALLSPVCVAERGNDGRADDTVDDGDDSRAIWTSLAPLPTPRQEHAVVAYGGDVVVIGGFDDDTTVDSVEAYDVVADARTLIFDGDTWREGTAMPAADARGASAVCALDGAVYVFGGSAVGSVATASRYIVGEDRWAPLPPLPRALDHVLCVAAADIDGDTLWIVSGRENGLANHTGTLLRFDPTTQTYAERAPLPTSRAGAAAAVVDGTIVVVGGEGAATDTGVFAAVERYVVDEDRWETLPAMRTPRHGFGAAAIDNTLYVPGGATVRGFGAVAVNERLLLLEP
ncbi:MAG TPA: hypothetical protein VGF99_15990 [Myxococcota bacterium]